MRKLLALLLLTVVSPAFAQEYTPQNPVADQTYTVIKEQITIPLDGIDQKGGTSLTLYDDGVTYQPLALPFDFYYFGNLYKSVYVSQNGFISFTSNANGCCSGNPLPYLDGNQYYNVNNSIFAMWSDLADFQFGNPYYKATGNSFTVGWYGVEELGSPNKFDFEIKLLADNSFSINYGAFDYNMQTWRYFTSGFQGDTSTEFYQIYNGSQPQSLQNTTYTIQSSELTMLQVQVDCNKDPMNVKCIISASTSTSTASTSETDTTSTNGTTTASIMDASQPQSSSSSSEPASSTQEAAQESPALAADPVAKETQTVLAASAATSTESMKNETTEKQLADSIDKDILSLVLSIIESTSVQQGGSDSSGSSSGSTSSSSTSASVAGIDANNQSQSGGSDASNAEVSATTAVEETLSAGRTNAAASIASTEQGAEAAYQASTDTVAFVQSQAAESAFGKDAVPTIIDTPVGAVDLSSINASDPTSSSSFANLEAAGVLNNRVEEKSDAEKKADQVVAANKEQQDEISKNYMDADQSGIVAAMGAETDVNSYLRRMLSDAAVWYRPEDIYKGVVIKDNARGSYFLEKGNTDLYKKLIEEQYK